VSLVGDAQQVFHGMTQVTRLTLDDDGALERRRIHLREISDDLDAPLDTVGQDLHTARLRRGDDLASVSRVLKIRKDHLEALEEDRVEALPGRTYAVGFIRSYADYLGLDAVQCVERYKAEIAGRTDSGPPPITIIDEDAEHRMPHGWKIMAGVVVVLVLFGAYQVAVSVDRMMTERAVEPVPTQPVHRPVAHRPVAPQPAAQVQQPAPAADAAATQPAPVPALPQGIAYGESNIGGRVVLRAREALHIMVIGHSRVDGHVTVFINRNLNPGDSYRVPNQPGVTLTTTNPGAVQVEVDGAPIGTAGSGTAAAEGIMLDPETLGPQNSAAH
jgi:cytoskeleton protein RodZ